MKSRMTHVWQIVLLFMLIIPVDMQAQNYDELWQKVREAREKDHPRTQIDVLEQIQKKAQAEKNYGQLLSAGIRKAGLQTQIAPDSLEVEIARLEASTEQYDASDPTLAAVCRAILGKIYTANNDLGENHNQRGKDYFAQALARPELLAAVKCLDYKPLVIDKKDSEIFGNDMLHVVGMEAKRYDVLYDYYKTTGNRRATCMARLKWLEQRSQETGNRAYMAALDSMLNEYGDLDVAGEVAIRRFENMRGTDAEKYHYGEEIIRRWSSWERMKQVNNAMEAMKSPHFDADFGSVRFLPYQPRTVRLNNVRNIGRLTLTIWRLKGDGETEYKLYNDKEIEKTKKLIEGDAIQSITRQYSGIDPWVSTKDSMLVNGMKPGVYLFEIQSDKENGECHYQIGYVSDVYVIWEELPEQTIRYVAVSATTGKPLPGAKVKLTLSSRWDDNIQTKTLTTDNKGECLYTYEKNSPREVYAYTTDDKASMTSDASSGFSCSNPSSTANHIRVYTDRSIYRPGQTIHTSLVAFRRYDKDKYEVRAGDTIRVRLLDANMQQVAEQTVCTDDFGTASTDFVLPASGLTGNFTIQARGKTTGNTSVKVEEYKRPTFELKFDDYKEKYVAGDTVRVKGYAKTYAGVPVQGAKVKYTITRRQALWCWWYHGDDDKTELYSEETTTDDEGAFYMSIPVILPKAADLYEDGEANPYWRRGLFYNFVARADVTDLGGETHGGSFSLPMGTRTTSLSSSLPGRSIGGGLKTVTYHYTNAAGEPIDGKVKVSIDGKKLDGGRAFDANKPINIGQLSSGEHTFVATCGDNELTEKVVIFNLTDKSPVVETHDWYYASANTFPRDGKPVYIQFGSSDKDQHVVYSLFAGRKVLESGTLTHDNTLTTREFNYKEEYGDGITFTCAWVREGRLYQHSSTISKPEPDKSLKVEWKTFRDRLVPGQKEEWSLTIKKPDGKPANSNFMATMYDKSLDQLYSHQWGLSTSFYRALAQTEWSGISSHNLSASGWVRTPYQYVPSLLYSHFNPTDFDGLLNNYFIVGYGAPRKIRVRGLAKESAGAVDLMAAPLAESVAVNEVMVEKAVLKDTALPVSDNEAKEEESVPEPENQMRENLDETAFFYPQMRTDSKGDVVVTFTLPESLTTWKFIGLAHDKEMNHGNLTGEAIAQKTVMVSPNVPRFVRQGDRATISTRLMSTSENSVSGTTQLEIVDPQTEKVIFTTSQPFTIKPQGTSSATFSIAPEVIDGYSLLIARVSAKGDGYSDGEQHYLPVLSNKEQVLNTLPFTQHGDGTKTIDLTKLFPENTTNHRLTVEYTNHPSWLMVQALPYVGSADEHNAISLVSAYYANMLGQSIINSNPKIRQTIDEWRNENANANVNTKSLLSSLEKNQELKTLVLGETPWVLDAQQETRQKQDLIKFFDKNLMDKRISSTLDFLKKLQNSDGSWSWWNGMRGSIYMTTSVSQTLVRLNTMLGEQQETKSMLKSAFKFMKKEIAKEVTELKKLEKKGFKDLRPSETAVNYLYLCALDGRDLGTSAKADIAYLVKLLSKKTTELTIYGKANSAVILAHHGYTKKAQEYLQSMKEYSVYTEEMGRYYDTRRAYYSWFDYRIPTEVAAIEALRLVSPDDKQTVEEMQRWLLQEKRTTAWNTPVNSVNAIYAFFGKDGVQKMAEHTGKATITLDGEPMEMSQTTAGLGYLRGVRDLDQTDSQSPSSNPHHPASITFEKNDTDTSWGAVYAQFLQTVTEIDDQTSGITVTREVLPTQQSSVLSSVTSHTSPLKVGDRVKVRITIKADRDYDFVQVIDKRAACMEPVRQLSGYHWGYYCAPKDCSTNYYFDRMAKGKHVVETEYYIDREGDYQQGTCTVQCAYAPEYYGRTKGMKVKVER